MTRPSQMTADEPRQKNEQALQDATAAVRAQVGDDAFVSIPGKFMYAVESSGNVSGFILTTYEWGDCTGEVCIAASDTARLREFLDKRTS